MCVFAGCFLVCFLLKRHLGLTNCTVSTSMSFCKLFHHLWKFPRYHAFRLLAKQKVWDYGLIVEKKTTGIGENIQWSWGILAFLLNRQGSYFTQMHGNFGFISGGLLVCTLKSSLRLGHQNLARLTARPSRTHFLLIVILGRNRSNWWDAMISNDTVDGSEIRLTTARMPQMLVFIPSIWLFGCIWSGFFPDFWSIQAVGLDCYGLFRSGASKWVVDSLFLAMLPSLKLTVRPWKSHFSW